MKRKLRPSLVLALALSILFPAAVAGSLEKDVRARWLGAWVIIDVESYSECGSMYTNNRVNGMLVKSKGGQGFEPGELAKIDKIDVKRSRVDVLVSVAEPVLTPYAEGPFTLYREVSCKLEFEVVLPREAVKTKDVEAVDGAIGAILERHATEAAARDSDLWNGREMEPYPEDYQLTLARLAVWRAEQTNLKVQAKLDQATQETMRLGDRVSSNNEYITGFARGVETARAAMPADCSALLSIELVGKRRVSAHGGGDYSSDSAETAEQRSERGFDDGKKLVYGLEMMRRLPRCFVPVPEAPPAEVALQQD
jgi:hypothetical protein